MTTDRPTSISVSYLCHSESSPKSWTAGQWTYHTVRLYLLINVFMLPFIFQPDRRDMYFAFLLMVKMPFILAFMFQVMQILVFRKHEFGNEAGLFSLQKHWPPCSGCMDIGWSDEINFCPNCFPQFLVKLLLLCNTDLLSVCSK